MLLLLDIGNTHTHVGWAGPRRVARQMNLPTANWAYRRGSLPLEKWLGTSHPAGVALCSVVPDATPRVREWVLRRWSVAPLELRAHNIRGVGLDYPRPETIGPDRLANAVAALARFGAPTVVVDFGTAVTLDVLDLKGNYVGGVIAPGLAAMTEYLHERTALLPRIHIRDVRRVIGRSTEEAMLAGAVHGYRGLIREILREIRLELGARRIPVVATGGYARLMARGLPEITAVDPNLTLDGLRRFWLSWMSEESTADDAEGRG
jgi:type III pantothenate kinase